MDNKRRAEKLSYVLTKVYNTFSDVKNFIDNSLVKFAPEKKFLLIRYFSIYFYFYQEWVVLFIRTQKILYPLSKLVALKLSHNCSLMCLMMNQKAIIKQ